MFAGGLADRAGFLRPDGTQRALRALAVWWVHSLLVFGFIASLPYTRLLHTMAGPLNLFFARPELGRMVPVTMEEVEKTERIGVSAINHFNQQQLLSLDACMECGRCEEACPAFATDKPLSPKKVVQDLKGLMTLTLRPAPEVPRVRSPASAAALHDEIIQAETLWSCTACSACVGFARCGWIRSLDHRPAPESRGRRRVERHGGHGLAPDAIERQSVGLAGGGTRQLGGRHGRADRQGEPEFRGALLDRLRGIV